MPESFGPFLYCKADAHSRDRRYYLRRRTGRHQRRFIVAIFIRVVALAAQAGGDILPRKVETGGK